MKLISAWLARKLSQMLAAEEREAVLGDLAESGETQAQAIRQLVGLIARRQIRNCLYARTWIAVFGVAAPLGLLLSLGCRMTASSTAIGIWLYFNNWTWLYLTNPGARGDLIVNTAGMLKQLVFFICWAWAAGFILGSVSRRAAALSGAVFCLFVVAFEQFVPGLSAAVRGRNSAVFSVAFYRVMFPFILQTVVVLLPAVWGLRRGLRIGSASITLRAAVLTCMAGTVTDLVLKNWGWVLCSAGGIRACMEWTLEVGYSHQAGRPDTSRFPDMLFTLAGPTAYILVTARRRGRHAVSG